MMEKKFKIELEKTEIKGSTPLKFQFGKIPVCVECGKWVNPDEKCHDGQVESLSAYYERVYEKPFIEEDWKWEVTDNYENVHGIDLEAELVDSLKKEYHPCDGCPDKGKIEICEDCQDINGEIE